MMPAGPVGEEKSIRRRSIHINAERRRRSAIQRAFDNLREALFSRERELATKDLPVDIEYKCKTRYSNTKTVVEAVRTVRALNTNIRRLQEEYAKLKLQHLQYRSQAGINIDHQAWTQLDNQPCLDLSNDQKHTIGKRPKCLNIGHPAHSQGNSRMYSGKVHHFQNKTQR